MKMKLRILLFAFLSFSLTAHASSDVSQHPILDRGLQNLPDFMRSSYGFMENVPPTEFRITSFGLNPTYGSWSAQLSGFTVTILKSPAGKGDYGIRITQPQSGFDSGPILSPANCQPGEVAAFYDINNIFLECAYHPVYQWDWTTHEWVSANPNGETLVASLPYQNRLYFTYGSKDHSRIVIYDPFTRKSVQKVFRQNYIYPISVDGYLLLSNDVNSTFDGMGYHYDIYGRVDRDLNFIWRNTIPQASFAGSNIEKSLYSINYYEAIPPNEVITCGSLDMKTGKIVFSENNCYWYGAYYVGLGKSFQYRYDEESSSNQRTFLVRTDGDRMRHAPAYKIPLDLSEEPHAELTQVAPDRVEAYFYRQFGTTITGYKFTFNENTGEVYSSGSVGGQ